MTHSAFVAAAALCLLSIAQPVAAQGQPAQAKKGSHVGRLSIGGTAGTLGIGPELGYRANRTIGVRANATFLSVTHSFSSNDVRYHGKVNLKSGGLMLDVYPFGGGFRLSAGARVNGNDGNLRATPMSSTTIGGMAFTPAQIGTISGHAEVKDVAPQLTVGYGGGLRRGLSLNVEGGALFQGAARIRDFTSNGTLANNSLFLTDLEKERVDFQRKVDDYKVYPLLQLELKYRF